MQFQGFKPEAMQRIAGTLGYNGDMSKFNGYLEANPEAKQKMDMYSQQAVNMMNGGVATKNLANGGYMDYRRAKQRYNAGLTNSSGERIYQGEEAYRGRSSRGRSAPPNVQQQVDMSPSASLPPQIAAPFVENQVYRPPADDPRDPRTKGMYPTYPDAEDRTRSMSQSPIAPRAEVPDTAPQIKKDTINRMLKPALPTGANVTATGTVVQGNQLINAGTGTVGQDPRAKTTPTTYTSTANVSDPRRKDTGGMLMSSDYVDPLDSATVDTTKSGDRIEGELDKTTAAEGTVSDGATVGAEQTTKSSVSDLTTTEGTSIDVEEVADRKMEIGERVDPVADAASAATFTEEIQAATATPTEKATVKGQLAELMTDFDGGETPAWAAGSMRAATAAMAARGLGSSSMAGQALIQAAMESALPIAAADAGTFAKFESQNLSNRQQRAMLAAEQRATFMGQEFDQKFQARVVNATKVSDIANMNFTADQQVALENSRAANTVNLTNMSNTQALLMGEVAALANLDMANLSNRQQAAVQNAQTFLATDMANLNNKQQTEMFKAQSRTQSLFTDTAAENASKQFNATSENQSDQFFANLKTQTSQFNASQQNAMKQFNSGEANSMSKFNAEIENQRDQFNATNSLVIAQSNATWRREVATAGTAAVNRANEINAQNVLGISNQAHANLWQEHGDLMEWAWSSSEGERDRQNAITLSHLAAGKSRTQAESAADLAASNAMGDFVGKLILGGVGKIFNW